MFTGSRTHCRPRWGDATAPDDLTASRNKLESFKHELSARSGKHVSAVAAQALIEDADSLLSQLQ